MDATQTRTVAEVGRARRLFGVMGWQRCDCVPDECDWWYPPGADLEGDKGGVHGAEVTITVDDMLAFLVSEPTVQVKTETWGKPDQWAQSFVIVKRGRHRETFYAATLHEALSLAVLAVGEAEEGQP
jgi:hypothetical protein